MAKLKHLALNKHPFSASLLFIFLFGAFAIITYHTLSHRSHERSATQNLQNKQKLIAKQLTLFNDTAQKELVTLQDKISKLPSASLEAIQTLLNPLAYQRHDGLLRFVWVDANDQVRLSSHTQYNNLNYSVRERDYIQHARQNPSEPHYSKLLKHARFDTDFITLSSGVISASSDRYLGTIMAGLDIEILRNRLAPILEGCQCAFTLTAP